VEEWELLDRVRLRVFRKEEHMHDNHNDVTAEQQRQNFNQVIACAREALRKAEQADVPARFKVALIASQLKDEEEFGKDGIERMDEELGLGTSTLYMYAKVPEAWAAEAFKTVSERLSSKGLLLSWSHWKLLASVTDKEKREALLDTTLTESLNVRDLASAVKEESGKTRSAPVGDEGAEAAHTPGRAFARLLSSLGKEAQEVEKRLLAKTAAGTTKPTDSELSEFRITMKSIEAVQTTLSSLKGQLEKVTSEATVAPASPAVQAPKPIRAKRTRETGAKDQVPMAT
jgi:hypothetical protein